MGHATSKFLGAACTWAADKVCKLLPPVVQYVVKHPIKTCFHVVNAALFLGSSVIAPPLLALAGFTGGGVMAGSLAAAVQSSIGPVVAGGMFATLQSAAMGGYGAAVVAGAMSATAIAAEGANAVAQAIDGTEEEETQD